MLGTDQRPKKQQNMPPGEGTVLKSAVISLLSEADVVLIRQAVRKWAAELAFSLVDQTKLVTAASELARNTVIYGGGGVCRFEVLDRAGKKALRLTFEDSGPGIPDIERALQDGFTSGKGLGLGLGGAKRLVNEFFIESSVGKGTKVVIVRWK